MFSSVVILEVDCFEELDHSRNIVCMVGWNF